MAAVVVAAFVLAACGADAPGRATPDTIDDGSRPLSNGRQRTETFLEPTAPSDDLFDDESPSSREPGAATSTTTTTAEPTTTIDDVSTSATSDPDTDPDQPTTSSSVPENDDPFPAITKAFGRFTAGVGASDAVSLTVIRDGEIIVQQAAGHTQDDSDFETDSPIVIGGVSKLVTALAIGRLAQQGLVDTAAPIPWAAMQIPTHGKWEPITVRDLIDQTSGMPAKDNLWKTSDVDCAGNVATLVKTKPAAKRVGKRTDANGNACALGLLIEQVTAEPLDAAIQRLVFAPLEAEGFHLTGQGLLPGDGGVVEDQQLLSTGGAGAYVVSTDDLAAVFASLSDDDVAVFNGTSVMKDQYGWGHTGIAKGVSACLWILEDGNTVLAASAVGGNVKAGVACDRFVPAVATDLDLGLGSDKPERNK